LVASIMALRPAALIRCFRFGASGAVALFASAGACRDSFNAAHRRR
jgi:hypothetical protein